MIHCLESQPEGVARTKGDLCKQNMQSTSYGVESCVDFISLPEAVVCVFTAVSIPSQ